MTTFRVTHIKGDERIEIPEGIPCNRRWVGVRVIEYSVADEHAALFEQHLDPNVRVESYEIVTPVEA